MPPPAGKKGELFEKKRFWDDGEKKRGGNDL